MASPTLHTKEARTQRLNRLQYQLDQLDQSQPQNARESDLLTREIRLIKQDRSSPPLLNGRSASTGGTGGKTPAKVGRSGGKGKASGRRTPSSATPARKRGKSTTGTKGLSADAFGGLGKALTPKNLEESLGSIVSLRNFCKQCMRYVQQADTLLDTLFVTTNSLKESGVLSKLAESKGKNLNTSDFTNILMALMNSPMGNNIFKKLGSGDSAEADGTTTTTAEPTVATRSASPPTANAPRPALPAPQGRPPV